MKKSILTLAIIAITLGATAQTTTITGYNTEIKTTYTSLNSAQTFVNGEKFNVNSLFTNINNSQYTNIKSIATIFNQQGTNTTISRTGISTAGSVTAAQIFTGGMNLGNEIINLKNGVNSKASATSVVNLTNRVTSLETYKADKVQVTADIAQAKLEANTYTDSKIDALDVKVTSEISRVDTRIDNLDTKVNTQVARLDGRIDALDLKVDATNITVENNRIEAAKATAQVQSNLDATNTAVSNLTNTVAANKVEAQNNLTTQVNRLDKRVDATDNKVALLDTKMTSEFKRVDNELGKLDNKINQNDVAIRRDLRNETERSMRADAALFAEMSGLGATMMAMGSMQSSAVYSPTKKGNISIGSGVYRDSFAYAASVSYYVNPNTRISSTVAGGTKTKVGGGLGVSFGF